MKKLVEAMGVEPMSVILYALSTTCLALEYTLTPPQEHKMSKSLLRDTSELHNKKCLLARPIWVTTSRQNG
jgi:hypothetical protein